MVRDDIAAQTARLLDIWQKPLSERLAQGKAIDNLRFLGFTDDNMLRLHCPENESFFREGDILRLHRGNPQEGPFCNVNLDYEDEDEIQIAPILGCGIAQQLEETPDGWILDFGLFDLSERYTKAFDEAAQSQIGRNTVLPVLMNKITPVINAKRYDVAGKLAERTGLNESQTEAFATAYATDSFYLIQGPPGTGKTWSLAYLVKTLIEDRKTVLISALTHRAINNALNKVRKIGPELPLCKIGINSQAYDLEGVESFQTFSDAPFADAINQGYAVGATPFGARSTRLQNVTFDVVIFDEASQITLPMALMGMLSAYRYIFIGDDKQLPPVFSALPDEERLARSIFETLLPHDAVTMLTQTYRLNEELTEWPSRMFYENQLESHESARAKRLTLSTPLERHAEIIEPGSPSVFIRSHSGPARTKNPYDADIVVELVEDMLQSGVPAKEIAVVTPFRGQARVVRTLLRRSAVVGRAARSIVADTVERMQGQERDVILYSLTTSDADFATSMAEFIFDPRRINVSVTRARVKLIVIGSLTLLEACPTTERAQEGWEALRDLINSCEPMDWE